MPKLVFSILYFVSCVFLPWYLTAIFAIVLIVYLDLWPIAILGGLLMDIAFGAPIPAVFSFAYIYSALFVLLTIIAVVLRQRMLE
jgi:hypothetical protein